MRLFIFIAAALALAAQPACDRDGGAPEGMPAAGKWKPPAPKESRLLAQDDDQDDEGDPEDVEGDPHAGLDMGGGGSGDPHAGLGGDQDPHAGLDMSGAADPSMNGMKAPDPDRPIDASRFLRGTLRASKETSSAIKNGAVVFLSAWPVDPTTGETLGAPVAVAKLTVTQLPMPFELTERNVMVDGTKFGGDVLITARVDGDGEARTKEPGDVEGQVRAKVPAKGLELVLGTALK